MNNKYPTVAVIGGGIIGSWTALHLAEAGVATTLIEQFPLPHTRGSSHGLSRAFRFLGELELDRLVYSLERWQSLERDIGEPLFVKTGLINFGPPGDPDLEKYMTVLNKCGRPFEWLDHHTIKSRFPRINYPKEWGAAWDPNGGILIAHRCLQAVQDQFIKLGGNIITARVSHIDNQEKESVNLNVYLGFTGQEKVIRFDQVVVCCGPWTAKMVPQVKNLLQTVLTPVTYWNDPTGSYSVQSGFPIIFNARLTGIYGLPSCEYPGLVKMLYHGGPESDPERRDQADFGIYVQKVSEYVKEHLPLLDHYKSAILETCMYTMTPDGFPVIDRIDRNMVVGCGFSGSGFKHSPATGKMLAALALGKVEMIPEGFRADRYLLNRFQG